MNYDGLIRLIVRIADCIEANKEQLTLLDTEIGDADHGINMARGFNCIKAKIDDFEDMPMSEILISCGNILIREVAGSSGPLYGSMFKCAGQIVSDSGNEEITVEMFRNMLQAGIDRIQKLGRVVEGEKTMLDAILPAFRALEGRNDSEALIEAAAAAAEAANKTCDYRATKGRASYVQDRSIGHADPGAVSFSLMMGVIAEN